MPELPEGSFQPVQWFNTTEQEIPINDDLLARLARSVESARDVAFENVEIVYVDAETIVEINQLYLERDYVTDVITFRLDDGDLRAIEGTIYCCVPRIREQAEELGEDEQTEFVRIAVHGMLHLTGMDDAAPEEKAAMTRAENEIITIWKLTL